MRVRERSCVCPNCHCVIRVVAEIDVPRVNVTVNKDCPTPQECGNKAAAGILDRPFDTTDDPQ